MIIHTAGDKLYTGHILTMKEAIILNNYELRAREEKTERSFQSRFNAFQFIAMGKATKEFLL